MSAPDHGHGRDALGVGVCVPLAEHGQVRTLWLIERYDEEATSYASRKLAGASVGQPGFIQPTLEDFVRLHVTPYDTSEVPGNLITTAGWTRASNLLAGQGATQIMDAAHTRIGVGDGVGTAAVADTDLSAAAGATHRFFQLISGPVVVATNTLAAPATFGISDGNFAWNEFGIDIGNTVSGTTVAALLYNHKTSIAQGTKASGQTWAATATITYI